MAEPGVSELVATTLRFRTGKAADNMSKNNLLWREMNKKGNVTPVDGRTILETLEYAENGSFTRYSGYETVSLALNTVITAAEFDWKQCAVAVNWSGLESIQNRGKAQVINLLDARIKNAERTMKNYLSSDFYSDGTASGGKQVGGLQLLIADTPTTGVVGGIDRSTAGGAFWRNVSYSGVTDGGAAVSAANIQSYMHQVLLRTSRDQERTQFIIADNNYYDLFWTSMTAIQRVSESVEADAGYRKLAFAGGIPVYFDGGFQTGGSSGTGCPSNHMYFVNPEYIKLRYAAERNMTALDTRFSVNQDAEVRLIAWAGNLTLSNAALQGVLKA